ncbi:TPA: hypothetical protein ACG3P3_001576 [Clostridioides difficile]
MKKITSNSQEKSKDLKRIISLTDSRLLIAFYTISFVSILYMYIIIDKLPVLNIDSKVSLFIAIVLIISYRNIIPLLYLSLLGLLITPFKNSSFKSYKIYTIITIVIYIFTILGCLMILNIRQ